METENDVYRKLQKHLDAMPFGYPGTASGVELRLLKTLFTPGQAQIALELDSRFRSVEQIYARMRDQGMSLQELETRLEEMADRGNTFCKTQGGAKVYALMPLVVGMLELQVNRLTPELLRDTHQYFEEGYAGKYLSTRVPQMRVIPVQKSITAKHRIGTYDELRQLIDGAGDRIRIGECMCRKISGMAGHACKVTSRTETCMAFKDFADMLGRSGWGRTIGREEALQIATKNEEDGLVFQPGNEQEAQFICSCCGDCCGILMLAKAMPRPAEIVATNFYAEVEPDLCNGCGTCMDRCQMSAIALKDETATIIRDRCIGCGLCVSTCPTESIHLVKKDKERIPPRNIEALYEAM